MSFPPGYKKPALYVVRRDSQWCSRTGKMRYGSRIEARMTLRETAAKAQHGQSNRAEERAYECEISKGGCGGWHLTSQSYDPDKAKRKPEE